MWRGTNAGNDGRAQRLASDDSCSRLAGIDLPPRSRSRLSRLGPILSASPSTKARAIGVPSLCAGNLPSSRGDLNQGPDRLERIARRQPAAAIVGTSQHVDEPDKWGADVEQPHVVCLPRQRDHRASTGHLSPDQVIE